MINNSLSSKRPGNGDFWLFVFVAILSVIAWAVIFNPETIRIPLQTPVGVTLRGSMVGIGNVVQVRNISTRPLANVVVVGRNSGTNSQASCRLGSLATGQVAEAGWREWTWRVDPGETVTVTADGFLPIVFSSAQLGVR